MRFKKGFLVSLILSIFLLSGCLSKISYFRYRPAEIDLLGMKEITALYLFNPSFSFDEGDSFQVDMGDYLWKNVNSQRFSSSVELRKVQQRMVAYGNSRIRENLYRRNFFTLQPSEPLFSMLGFSASTTAEMAKVLGVEGVLVGKILSMSWNDQIEKEQKKEVAPDGSKQLYFVKYLRRDYKMVVQYELISFSFNKIVATRTFHHSYFDRINLTEEGEFDIPDDLFSRWLDSSETLFINQLVPQRIQETFYLKTDKEHRDRFEEAQSLALSGESQRAYEKYYALWKEFRLESAGYNAVILLEIQSHFFEAIKLMETLYEQYPTRNNKKHLEHLNEVAHEQLKLKSQLSRRK